MAVSATAPDASPVKIVVSDDASMGFVTSADVSQMIAPYLNAGKIVPSHVNTLEIQQMLNRNDNIESAVCTRRSNNRLWIEVVPMQPVARVFDGDDSYYVNRAGKRLTASLKYHTDVPVITGHLAAPHSMSRLMPLIEYIESREMLSQLVTAIKLQLNGDVILIPPFRGHVIQFGAPDTDISNKFDRLTTMYRDVMPVKGWDFYDTLSVKYAGQVVASRRKPRDRDPLLVLDPEGDASDNEDVSTMIVDNN